MEGGKITKWGEKFFFFFFFFLFTFQNDWNLFWVYQNGNFLPGKSISRRGKNQEKWLCPLREIFLLRPWQMVDVSPLSPIGWFTCCIATSPIIWSLSGLIDLLGSGQSSDAKNDNTATLPRPGILSDTAQRTLTQFAPLPVSLKSWLKSFSEDHLIC